MLDRAKTRIIGTLTCTLFIAGLLLAATAAQAKPFKQKTSGWINRTSFDADDNGNPLSLLTTIGRGTFGKSSNNEVSETGPFAGQFCEFDPAAGIVIVEIPVLSRSRIMRFANGDMLFANLATDGPISRLCVDTNSDMNTSEVHLVITGGTGKFEGASGRLLLKARSTTVLREAGFPVHIAVTQFIEGDVHLVGGHHDHDDHDD
jgi:hypothetical protein